MLLLFENGGQIVNFVKKGCNDLIGRTKKSIENIQVNIFSLSYDSN